MIRLISLDLDGTLLDPSGAVTPAAKAAIAAARSAGVRVVLNTGRPIPEAFWFAREAGCDSLVCALGGGALADSATGQIIRRWDIPEPSGRQALELCLNRDIELMIFAGDQILMDPFSKGVDKGRALALLSMMYGIPLCDCAGVGDSDNDLAMLQAVGTPIAMGNAAPAVKAAACRIAPSNAEDGVAQAILSCLENPAR